MVGPEGDRPESPGWTENPDHRAYELGPFRVDTNARIVLRGEMPLPLGERAVAILLRLVASPGQLVSKDALISAAWGDAAIEESNLTVQIAALRQALAGAPDGARWIQTLPRRGYRFVGPVAVQGAAAPPAPQPPLLDGVPTIAVLPFRAIDADPVPAYFAHGLVEEIVCMLAGLRELTVLSCGSTLQFRQEAVDPRQAGAALGVRYIVSGGVRRGGSGLRVIAELTDAETGAVLWSRSYDAQASLLFDAQFSIVAQIVDTLAPRVREAELRRVRSQRPDDLAAYHLVLQARQRLYRLERQSFEEAGNLLLRAVARDPDYPAAHVLGAEWHILRVGQGWSADPAADARAADCYAMAAISRDGTNARALAFLGHNKSFLQHDHDAALALFKQALDAGPNDAAALGWSSLTECYVDNPLEGIRRAERALTLSPTDPFGFRYQSFLCVGHYTAGNFEEAVKWGMRTMNAQPRYTSNLRFTAASLVALGRVKEARELGRRVLAAEPSFRVEPLVARHGYRDEARRIRIGQQLISAGLPP